VIGGWSAIALGVAGTAVGTYLGLQAISQKKDADRDCPNNACSATGASENSNAIRSANFSTVGFAVGAAGLGLGTVLLLVSRSAPHTTALRSRPPVAWTLTSGDVSARPGACEFRLSGTW
jgi:hypothetical protein